MEENRPKKQKKNKTAENDQFRPEKEKTEKKPKKKPKIQKKP